MSSITIHELDEDIYARLRVQALQNDRSMEDEARMILNNAFFPRRSLPNLADLALDLFGREYGIDLDAHLTHPAAE